MSSAAMTIEALPAGYGDFALVTCTVGSKAWRLPVESGPDERRPSLKSRLAQLLATDSGRRYIDLEVISQIDHDHIGAARALFSGDSLGLSFGDMWFCAPLRSAGRSAAEGQSLATPLGATKSNLPWNAAWGGKAVLTTDEAHFIESSSKAGEPRLTPLSPTPESRSRCTQPLRALPLECSQSRVDHLQ